MASSIRSAVAGTDALTVRVREIALTVGTNRMAAVTALRTGSDASDLLRAYRAGARFLRRTMAKIDPPATACSFCPVCEGPTFGGVCFVHASHRFAAVSS